MAAGGAPIAGEKMAMQLAGARWGLDSVKLGLQNWMECLFREVETFRCRSAFLGLPAASALLLQLYACSA